MAVEVVLGAVGAIASLSAGIAKTWIVHREPKRSTPRALPPERNTGSNPQNNAKFGSASSAR
jgi:hypothetical protein